MYRPNRSAIAVEAVLQRLALRLGDRSDLGHQHRRGDAVLVERAWRHQVAERLLVAEHQAQVGPLGGDLADVLEPGERLLAVHAGRLGHPGEQRRRHERGHHEPIVARGVGQDVVGEQPADLVTAQPPPRSVGLRDRHAEPVGIGIVRERDLCATRLRFGEQEVHRSRLLRVRERHRRERAVGLLLRGDHERRREPRRFERPQHDRATDAVHRRVRHRHAGHIGTQPHRRHELDVPVGPGVVETLDQRDDRPARARRSADRTDRSGRRCRCRSATRSASRSRDTPCSRCRPAGCATR